MYSYDNVYIQSLSHSSIIEKFLCHIFLGLPLGLFPFASSSYTIFTNLSSHIHSNFAFNFLCFSFTISITASCPSASLTPSFLTLSILVKPCTLLKHVHYFKCLQLAYMSPLHCPHLTSIKKRWHHHSIAWCGGVSPRALSSSGQMGTVLFEIISLPQCGLLLTRLELTPPFTRGTVSALGL